MILGSHNSMSYLEPTRWWMRPFRIFACCQKKSIREQYNCGVRCFDLRVSFDSNGRAIFSHGLIDFLLPVDFADGTTLPDPTYSPVHSVLSLLDTFAICGEPIYIRLILEKKNSPDDFRLFVSLCCAVGVLYTHLTFIGGVYKKDWRLIYDFHDPISETEIEQPIGSMATDARWYERLIPVLYTRRSHEYTFKEGTRITLYDFI